MSSDGQVIVEIEIADLIEAVEIDALRRSVTTSTLIQVRKEWIREVMWRERTVLYKAFNWNGIDT